MVFTKSRAACSLNSTATRAESPCDSFKKSILSACSSGALNGWSKDTFDCSSLNHPLVHLLLPFTFTFSTIIVLIKLSPKYFAQNTTQSKRIVLSKNTLRLRDASAPLRSGRGWPQDKYFSKNANTFSQPSTACAWR